MMRVRWISCALMLCACGARSGLDFVESDREVPVSPDGSERCDGGDDDGDGRIDEGIPPVRCGLGACFAEIECVDGHAPACVPGAPSAEVCNSVDDDCDGRVDEGLPGSVLSEPVILRAEDEGDTGTCQVCARAFSPNVLPTEEGLLALWQLDFLFTDSQPNTFVRRLAADGTPLEPIRLLTERNTTFGMRATPIREGRSLLTFCERFADGTDHPAVTLINGGGSLLAPISLFDEEVRCAVGRPPEPLWTGTEYLAAWGSGDQRFVRVERVDADGRPLASREVSTDGPLVSVLPRSDGALLGIEAWPQSSLVRVDSRGDAVAEHTWSLDTETRGLLLLPSGGRAVGYATRNRPLGPDMIITELLHVPIEPDGRPLNPTVVAAPDGARYSRMEVLGGAPRGRGVLLGVRVQRRPEPGEGVSGEQVELWEIDEDGARGRTFVAEDHWLDLRFADNGGQTVMIYVVPTSDRFHNEVRLRTLGCEP